MCFLSIDDYLWKLPSSGFGAPISSFTCSHLFLPLAFSTGQWLEGRSDGHLGGDRLRLHVELINSTSHALSSRNRDVIMSS